MAQTRSVKLNTQSYQRALRSLARREPGFAKIIKQWGPPPMWTRKPGFATLIHIILEQQVSLASARAAMRRLTETVTPLSPKGFMQLNDAALKKIGFSRQKIIYGRDLAQNILEGKLNLRALQRMSDDAARTELIKIKGIGKWSADIYLLMALRRPDIFPSGDLAVAIAAQKMLRRKSPVTQDELDARARRWQPWRAVAARILWHYYLETIHPDLPTV